MPYEQTTLWKNSDVIWAPDDSKVKNQFPQGEDVAVDMASSGYYK